MWHKFFVTISIFVAIHKAAIIQPTSINGNTETYMTSPSANFTDDTINCGAAICNIECVTSEGCYNAKINEGTSTTTINILCSDYWSCYGLSLSANSITTFNLKCVGYASCRSAQFNVDTATNIDIECNYNASTTTSTAGCYYTYLYARNSGTTNIYSTTYNLYRSYFYLDDANTANVNSTGQRGFYKSYIYADNMKNGLNVFCTGPYSCHSGGWYTRYMSSDVSISCDGAYACYNADLYGGTMSGNVYVRCDGIASSSDYACYYFDIDTGAISGSLTVDCMNDYNCRDIEVHCPETSCNIDCSSSYSCYLADIYINDRYDSSYLNLQCNGSTACQTASIYCSDNQGGSSQLVYDSTSAKYKCNSYGCCPMDREETTCIAGQPCKIDCGGGSCAGYNIDASLATSLTLNCTGSNACDGVKVQCPTVSNAGSCIIDCPDQYSCRYGYIIAGDNNAMTALDLQCGGSYGCQLMRIEANASTITTVNVNCTGSNGCDNMQFGGAADITDMDINCGYYGCIYAQFDGTAGDLSIACSESRSCFSLDIDYTIGNSIFTLDCLAQESCDSMDMNIKSTQANADIAINCISGATSAAYGACGTTSFYIYGYTANNARSNNVTIQCSDYDCYAADFRFYDTYNIDVGCNEQSSCQQLSLRADTSNYLNLDCNDTDSCNSASIYCPYKDIGVCDIECSSKGSSCYNAHIYVPSGYIYGYLDLKCNSILQNQSDIAYSCSSMDINCNSGSRTSVEWTYNYTNDNYECEYSGSSYCCPYYNGPKTACTANTNCVIDCKNQNCTNEYIDGVDASSLTVYCGKNNCTDTFIYCPDNGCTLECRGDNACDGTNIIYNGEIADGGTVNVNCGGTVSNDQSCNRVIISAEYANTININCTAGSYNYACYYVTLNGQYANTVNIDLYEEYGSYEADWNINNAQTINYNSRGNYGSYYDTINAGNAMTMTVNCVSEASTYSSACYNNYWYIPADATVNCYGTGCQNMINLYPTGGVFQNLNFNMYSCAECGNAADCFQSLTLYCGSNFNNNQFLANGVCGDGDCGCDTFINNAVFSTDTNTDKCYTPITSVSCQENQECNILCDSTTQDCSNSIIDGSKASFLTVTCGSNYYCRNMLTLCPNEGCDILCTAYSACSDNTVSYNGVQNDGAKVYIECSASYGCHNMRLNARNAYWVDIVANRQGYYNGQLYVNNVATLTINATGSYSFYSNDLYAENAGYMVLGCQSDINQYACYNNYMYLPDNPTFLCYGYGCYYLRDIYFDNADNNAIWNVYGCGQCDSPFTCINDIDINCGRTSTTSYSYNNRFYYTYGAKTSSSSNYGNCTMPATTEDCGCYELFNQRIQYQQTQGGKCTVQFPATRAPTSPTMNPTDGPTQNPTLPTISPSSAPTIPTLSPTLPTVSPSAAPTIPTTSPTTASPTDVTSAPTGQEPGGNADAANVISTFISFAVLIATVINY